MNPDEKNLKNEAADKNPKDNREQYRRELDNIRADDAFKAKTKELMRLELQAAQETDTSPAPAQPKLLRFPTKKLVMAACCLLVAGLVVFSVLVGPQSALPQQNPPLSTDVPVGVALSDSGSVEPQTAGGSGAAQGSNETSSGALGGQQSGSQSGEPSTTVPPSAAPAPSSAGGGGGTESESSSASRSETAPDTGSQSAQSNSGSSGNSQSGSGSSGNSQSGSGSSGNSQSGSGSSGNSQSGSGSSSSSSGQGSTSGESRRPFSIRSFVTTDEMYLYSADERGGALPWQPDAPAPALAVIQYDQPMDEIRMQRALFTVAKGLHVTIDSFVQEGPLQEDGTRQLTGLVGMFKGGEMRIDTQGRIEVTWTQPAQMTMGAVPTAQAPRGDHDAFLSRLMADYPDLLVHMVNPTADLTVRYSVLGMPRYNYGIYDTAGNGVAARSLGRMEFVFDGEGRLLTMRTQVRMQLREEGERYTPVDLAQARQLLVDGKAYTDCTTRFPGLEQVEGVELVYLPVGDGNTFVPYYRFYVRLPGRDLAVPGAGSDQPDLHAYGLWYVCALPDTAPAYGPPTIPLTFTV